MLPVAVGDAARRAAAGGDERRDLVQALEVEEIVAVLGWVSSADADAGVAP